MEKTFHFESSTLDNDECLAQTHKCRVQATCINTIGSYNSACNEGFTGNGAFCKSIKFANFERKIKDHYQYKGIATVKLL